MPPNRRIKAPNATPAPAWARGSAETVSNGAPSASGGPTHSMTPRAKHECGDLDMRIARDGTWFYKGSPIGRKELVCLFASVLQREADGTYMLETPVERGRIEVEDAPFIAVEMVWRDCDCGGGAIRQCLSFRTNCDEVVPANASHPIRVQIDPRTREPRPYIMVRPGLEAKINRAVFYEMVALAVTETLQGRELMGVWSEGIFFPIDEAVPQAIAAE